MVAPRPVRLSIAGLAVSMLLIPPWPGRALADPARGDARSRESGGPSNAESALVLAYEQLLRGRDLEGFQRSIDSRYTEASLTRIASTGDVLARRAAVLSLGVSGSFGSNAAVARRLKDPDATVRRLASEALWSIWCRADTPVNNTALEAVQALIERGQLDEAIREADRLIKSAPGFAEAYNQRAIAYCFSGRLAESAADCKRVLELNPYHFGALSGLGQCQLGLDLRAEAIRTFRRALALQPYSDGLRATIAELEAAGR
jgi:tetratricopeptide (TPR) repeat protein